jgi:hypothetical protein
MADRPMHTLRGPRYTTAQRDALEAIGEALKQHLLDFATAVELGDLVKAGQVDDALTKLTKLRAA